MQNIIFKAQCQFKIGDHVYCAPSGSRGECKKRTITDILTIFRQKNNSVAFMYELDGNGKYVRIADGVKHEETDG